MRIVIIYHFLLHITFSCIFVCLCFLCTFILNQNDASNVGSPIYFSTTPDGIDGVGEAWTQGVKYFINNAEVADLAAYAAAFDTANTRRVEIEVEI